MLPAHGMLGNSFLNPRAPTWRQHVDHGIHHDAIYFSNEEDELLEPDHVDINCRLKHSGPTFDDAGQEILRRHRTRGDWARRGRVRAGTFQILHGPSMLFF